MTLARMVLIFLIAAVGTTAVRGADDGINDGVDRTDPNFVTASLVIASSGEELFSCVGHAFIRLECPTFKLDYCFSDESENVRDRVFAFLAGRLKMGMISVPTEKLLDEYRKDRRGVRQYRLNLASDVKQRLWKLLDGKVAEGVDFPYDYDKRGCAKSVLMCIGEALRPSVLEVPLTARVTRTRREVMYDSLDKSHPWNLFILNAIGGIEADNIEDVVTPISLLSFLQKAKVGGMPVLVGPPVELLPAAPSKGPSWFTPMVAGGLLVLLAIGNWFVRRPFIDWLFLGLQSILGAFFTYLITFSALPTAHWNWLIVPFNLLPLVFWRWRRYWAWPFAAVLVAWESLMLLYPHQLTDWSYVVIVAAYIVFYAKQGSRRGRLRN